MNHLLVAPLLLPLAGGALALLVRGLAAQRIVGVLASVALLAVAIMLFGVAADGAAATYDVGDWPVPYGITLVLDRLSATLLLVTAVLAVAVAVYSLGGADRRGSTFTHCCSSSCWASTALSLPATCSTCSSSSKCC
jgi:multicomponent K+:H+ antiporter subunit D